MTSWEADGEGGEEVDGPEPDPVPETTIDQKLCYLAEVLRLLDVSTQTHADCSRVLRTLQREIRAAKLAKRSQSTLDIFLIK